MFNFDAKNKAIRDLKASVCQHESLREQVQSTSLELFKERQRAASEVIQKLEAFINNLSNTPKEFEKVVSEYRIQAKYFREAVRQLEIQEAKAVQVAGGTGVAGAAAGVGVAALGPSAAMAIATTFGTASTGTAISTLSGAAATNAALAWLGGGALAAGGGGMAAGNFLLAMAGPVGWTIGGATLVGSGVYLNCKNAQIAEEATKKRLEVESEIRSLKIADTEIRQLLSKTRELSDGCLETLEHLQRSAPYDYKRFSLEQKQRLATLVNHISSLGNLLNKQTSL
ncbi:hypothetical protein [Vacuolonema iberomarrocanum]|uniref:hypothetical protein n=1 Tax=Vacuolonema iberomarrocanum TaxID=3454632 RepID=UPI0019F0699B|nr:hypothetical protein [filamentous cyanobacterium LEGE 07170]